MRFLFPIGAILVAVFGFYVIRATVMSPVERAKYDAWSSVDDCRKGVGEIVKRGYATAPVSDPCAARESAVLQQYGPR